jgi:hypothetical protein
MATRMRLLALGALVSLGLAAIAPFSFGQDSPKVGPAEHGGAGAVTVGEQSQGSPGQLVDAVSRERRLNAAQVRAEVHDALRTARSQLEAQPGAVVRQLKLVLERLDRVAQLPERETAELREQLVTLLRDANRQAVTREIVDAQNAADRAAALDGLQAAAALDHNQEKVRQLMARLESLMSEQRYQAASALATGPLAEAAGEAAVAIAADKVAQLAGGHALNTQLRGARQRGVVGTLASVELSHMPFADDEPMVFPRADMWQSLSERRNNEASVDLRSKSPAEARIRQELETPTKLEFIETPLNEAVAYLQDLHGIAIQLDQKALADANVFADTPVTLAVDNVSLRTSLRLLLRPLDLTYVVEDEVLLITTTEVASQEVVNVVYPLGDLALPVSAGSASGNPGFSNTSSFNSGFNLPGLNGQNPPGQNNQSPNLPF